jgi:IMP cyclohydrolase
VIRGLERLSALRYPGRGIILGRDRSGRFQVAIYFITGRSASSQARALIWEPPTLWTRPTDEETLKKGHVDLLIYPAAIIAESGLAISNGKQTSDLSRALQPGFVPARVLSEGLKSWSYEPDAPIHTPRISACYARDGRAGLHIVKRLRDGSEERVAFAVPGFRKGSGLLLTTYAGPDRKVCPSFEGTPKPVRLIASGTARETAETVYGVLRPPRGKRDFRVSAACLFLEQGTGRVNEVAIINRSEKGV